jgi:hypothetical protein
MLLADAHACFNSTEWWDTATCTSCNCLIQRGGATVPEPGQSENTHALIVCHDCAYKVRAAEFRQTGIMSGSSLPTTALLRRDLDLYRPFFDTEVSLTVSLQAVHERYRDHPALNDSRKKRAILVTMNGAVFERDWGEDFKVLLADRIDPTTIVVEIFDGMCGYVGIDVHPFDPATAGGMWVQGQVREKNSQAWYRACYADRAFVDKMNAALRTFVGLPHGYTMHEHGVKLPPGLFGSLFCHGDRSQWSARAWQHAEDNLRAYLCRTYDLLEFQPSWIDGSGFRPQTDRELRTLARWREINSSRRKAGLPEVPEDLWTLRPSDKAVADFGVWVQRVSAGTSV